MCGIGAIYESRRTVEADRVARLRRSLEPRGPDACEDFTSPRGALVATRLAVVDPRGPGGPLLQTRCGRFRIAYNGELYNHAELRAALGEVGDTLATGRDTEVVLELVAALGHGAAPRLRGQFAYLVEDSSRGTLLGARDSNGVCPLFYGRTEGDGLVAASTAAGVLDAGGVPSTLRSLPQGHTLEYEVSSGRLGIQAFAGPVACAPATTTASAPSLDSLVRRTVLEKVPTDVPYATVVGGLDSSLVTALCAGGPTPPRVSVTVRSAAEAASSDVRNARLLERLYGIPAVIEELDASFVVATLPAVIEQLCSANYLAVLAGLMSSKAARVAHRHGAKVLLTGGGADELFGGYAFAWSSFPKAALDDNLAHIRRQTGSFECHREDATMAAVGVEVRPAYFSAELAAALDPLPLSTRLPGLDAGAVVDKAVLRRVARDVPGFPREIADATKQPIFRSTSMTTLFDQVAHESLPEPEARDWFDAHMRGTPWVHYLFGHTHAATWIHKLWSERFPGLRHIPPRVEPPNYADPEDYGAYHPCLGMPVLQRRAPARRRRNLADVTRTPSRGLMSF